MSLPGEVIDRIIDMVAEDRQTLRAIAQVALVFVNRAHHHLFSNIYLNLPFRSSLDRTVEILQEFLQVLRDGLQFPGIGIVHHIRHFRIKDPLGCSKHAAGIFRLLCDINRLESLTLSLYISFLTLGEECRASLIDLCHSPNLNALTIYGLFDIPKSLLHGSHIKQIHLFYLHFLSYSSDQPKTVYKPESITTIGSQFHSVLDALHAGGGEIEPSTRRREALACLQELDITVSNIVDIPLCLDAASFAGVALKDVKLQIFFSKLLPKSTPAFSFHSLSNLHILQLDLHQSYQSPVSWVFYTGQLLQSFSLPPSLEKLRFSLITCPVLVVGKDVPSCKLDDVDWHSLDRVLIQPPFSSIPGITLTFRQLFEFRPVLKCDDDILAKYGRHFLPEMPLFSASRPGSFVVDVDCHWQYPI